MTKVKFKGREITLKGEDVYVGSYAPKITLVAHNLTEFSVGGNSGIEILVTLPSLDIEIYATQIYKFNEIMADKYAIKLIIVSMDLPFAMESFCLKNDVKNLKVGSDFRGREFGQKYGVLIDDGEFAGLRARTILVIRDGVIIHKQILPNLEDEPNYDAVFDSIKRTGGCNCGCM